MNKTQREVLEQFNSLSEEPVNSGLYSKYTQSFNKHVLRTSHRQDTVLETQDNVMNKIGSSPLGACIYLSVQKTDGNISKELISKGAYYTLYIYVNQ